MIVSPLDSDGSATWNRPLTKSTVPFGGHRLAPRQVPLFHGLGARRERVEGEAGHDEEPRRRHAGDGGLPPGAARVFALTQVVVFDAEQAGEDLELGGLAAVLSGAYVGRQRTGGVTLEQSRRKTLQGRIAAGQGGCMRFAADDQALDSRAAAKRGERPHLLIDPLGPCSIRRTDDDQGLGLGERLPHRSRQVGGRGQFFAVTEHRPEA